MQMDPCLKCWTVPLKFYLNFNLIFVGNMEGIQLLCEARQLFSQVGMETAGSF